MYPAYSKATAPLDHLASQDPPPWAPPRCTHDNKIRQRLCRQPRFRFLKASCAHCNSLPFFFLLFFFHVRCAVGGIHGNTVLITSVPSAQGETLFISLATKADGAGLPNDRVLYISHICSSSSSALSNCHGTLPLQRHRLQRNASLMFSTAGSSSSSSVFALVLLELKHGLESYPLLRSSTGLFSS